MDDSPWSSWTRNVYAQYNHDNQYKHDKLGRRRACSTRKGPALPRGGLGVSDSLRPLFVLASAGRQRSPSFAPRRVADRRPCSHDSPPPPPPPPPPAGVPGAQKAQGGPGSGGPARVQRPPVKRRRRGRNARARGRGSGVGWSGGRHAPQVPQPLAFEAPCLPGMATSAWAA
jgi:hypothetical protein